MKVTDFTVSALAAARQKRELLALGYEEISAGGGSGRLWELDRGIRTGHRIVDAIVGVGGKNLFVKAERHGRPPQHRYPAFLTSSTASITIVGNTPTTGA